MLKSTRVLNHHFMGVFVWIYSINLLCSPLVDDAANVDYKQAIPDQYLWAGLSVMYSITRLNIK